MKHLRHIILTLALVLTTISLSAQTTSELRFRYVRDNLGLDAATFERLAPTLRSYIRDMKDAGDIYDDVKDQYKNAIRNNTLTDRQAAALTRARLRSEAKELEVKNAYYPRFQAIIAERYIFRLMKLASDKKSKFVPSRRRDSDDE